MLRSSIYLVFVLLLSCFVSAYAQEAELERLVRAEGYGATRDEAIKDAYRAAVENAIGVTVISRVIVENGKLIEDRILTNTSGFIKKSNIIVDYDDTEQLVVIDAVVSLQDLRKEFAAFEKIDRGAKIDGSSIHADRTQRLKVFTTAVNEGPDRLAGVVRTLQRAISIDMEEPQFALLPDKSNQLPYDFTFIQSINSVRYNEAVRRLDMLFNDLLAEKAPYKTGVELKANEVVLFSIDGTATKYTFNQRPEDVMPSLNVLFIYLDIMRQSPTFRTIFYDKSKNIVDSKTDEENRGQYFMFADRTLEPRFVGDEKITLSGKVDMNKLIDFADLMIVSAFSTRDSAVQYEIGHYYFALEDYENAFEWYERATEQGHRNAQASMGEIYFNGYGVAKNIEQAIHWYTLAAKQGYTYAQYMLGGIYYSGIGVDRDIAQAIYWYELAANGGDADSQYILGDLYYNGEEVKRDYNQAFRWYELAAKQGNMYAQHMVGELYYSGDGIKRDYAQAAYWYERAAEQGHVDAQYKLGEIYEDGEGVAQDHYEAIVWYAKAAEQGHKDAKKTLGFLLNIYSQRAAQGDAKAQLGMGNLYYNGYAVPQSYKEARAWYEKAAKLEYAAAMYMMGHMYDRGLGVAEDLAQAVYWYEQAAKAGLAEAMFKTGDYYMAGWGVEQDLDKARYWQEQGIAVFDKRAIESGSGMSCLAGAPSWVMDGEYGDRFSAVSAADLRVAGKQFANIVAQDNAIYGAAIAISYHLENTPEYSYAWPNERINIQEVQQLDSWASPCNELYVAITLDPTSIPQDVSDDTAIWQEFVGPEEYAKLANVGDPNAQFLLASSYFAGKGIPQDYKQTEEWLIKAAEQNYHEDMVTNAAIRYAQISLAILYSAGHGLPQNYAKAMEWYAKAADNGDLIAQYELGDMYYEGNGVAQDYQKALEYYTEAINQTVGQDAGKIMLGDASVDHMYDEDSNTLALKIMQVHGMLSLYAQTFTDEATGLVQGTIIYRVGDDNELAKYVDSDVLNYCTYNIGKIYYSMKRYADAREWLEKAAEDYGIADAQYELGNMYYTGTGVAKNLDKAQSWFTAAAEQGHADAQKMLTE